jgi:hypothetical protein
MNPWINIILLIPAVFIVLIIVLVRIKGKLENNIYRYRHEGVVLQTSLALFRLGEKNGRLTVSVGLALLTGERLIVFDWKQRIVFDCEFQSEKNKLCNLQPLKNNKSVIVHCHCQTPLRVLILTVRNPDAWDLEFSRLRSYKESE